MRRLLVIAIALLPSVAHAEDYICRTQARSCAFSFAGAVRDGTACHCATQSGPISGTSMQDPTAPTPARPAPLPVAMQAAPNHSAECFRGIGNCPEISNPAR